MAGTLVPTFTFGPTGFVAPSGPAVLAGVQGDINAAFGNNLNYQLMTPQGQLASSEATAVSISQAITGWDSATVAGGVVGRNVESRAAFEQRRRDSVAGNSFGPITAILGAIAKVPNVLDFFGYNNNTIAPVTINGVTIPAY